MNTLAEYHASLSTMLIGQTICAVAWNDQHGAPIFTLENNDSVLIHVYVSTSDYDLAVSMTHNEKTHLAYILYGDKFASAEVEVRSGTIISDSSDLSACVDTTIQEIILDGSGQSVVLRIGLSNGQQIQYSTSFSNTDCLVKLLYA